MNIRHRVTLTAEERSQLGGMVQGGRTATRKVKRAQILLAAHRGSTDEAIAVNVAVGTSTVYRTKQRFVEEGLERALSELPRAGACRKLDVRLTVHATVSAETIHRRRLPPAGEQTLRFEGPKESAKAVLFVGQVAYKP